MLHDEQRTTALLTLGFRPFFLGAAVYAVISVALWIGIYSFGMPSPLDEVSRFSWHAHEMIYGYSLAVIAGFLLTAAGNWTGERMLQGNQLLILFLLWVTARLVFVSGVTSVRVAGVLDCLFIAWLIHAVAAPCIRTRQWKQMAIIGKLVLLGAGNLLFYLGVEGVLVDGIHWGVYGGLYIVIGLILTMARRVVPFFIEMGVDHPVKLRNSKWLDMGSLFLFLGFFISEVFARTPVASAVFATGLFAINALRLRGWYTRKIWQKPLLWSLYIALVFITLGFALFAITVFAGTNTSPATHAFAFGGIGLITLSMMSRVSLAHTGRSIRTLPGGIASAFAILCAGALVRVLFPLLDMSHYPLWITLSQALWITAFALFVRAFFPVLIKARIEDNAPGRGG